MSLRNYNCHFKEKYALYMQLCTLYNVYYLKITTREEKKNNTSIPGFYIKYTIHHENLLIDCSLINRKEI